MTYRKILSMTAALAVVAGAPLAMAPAASAQDRPVLIVVQPSDVPTRRVSYTDLNLASLAGEKALNHRVAGAVISVCEESAGSFRDFYADLSCQSESWGRARPQITLAVRRAREIAAAGYSAIPPIGIAVASIK